MSAEEKEKRTRAAAEYERPADPATYAGAPTQLGSEDRAWLETLDHQIWRETDPDRFGHRHRVEGDRIFLTQEELDRVFRLIQDHHLVTTMGSGSFGFGYSLAVYEEPERVAVGVEETPEFRLCLTDRHIPHPGGLTAWPAGTREEQRELAWRLFSQFAFSPVNLEILKRNGMDPPRRRSDLDY